MVLLGQDGITRPVFFINMYNRQNIFLHLQRLQLHAEFPEPDAANGSRADLVLGRLPVQLDGSGADILRAAGDQSS